MKDIYSLIKTEEANYALPIPVTENYDWNMKDHVTTTILYKNSQYKSGKTDDKPFFNIIRPILNVAYRAEGFDVKDIDIYVDSADDYYKSFLVKKFHEKWAKENGIDTFIDELVESYVDFGGVLVKDVDQKRPEVSPLQALAFGDQTDLLAGPFGFKHNFAPDQLKDMPHWGDSKYGATASIDEVIRLASKNKNTPVQATGNKANTPGKYIEVYEVHGVFPTSWLKTGLHSSEQPDDDNHEEGIEYSRQLHVVCFYQSEGGDKPGITLYAGEEPVLPFKLLKRDPIYGRALGFGGAEELFEAQIWVNYDQIRMKGMLDQASKVLYKTTDGAFAARNKTNDLDNGEILVLEDGKDIQQLNTIPVNLPVFEKNVAEWQNHAKEVGSAGNAISGTQMPNSHTSFRLQALVAQEGHALHDYRKGKLSVFVEEIYREWLLPRLMKDLAQAQQFLTDLSLDEMQAVAEAVVNNEVNDKIKNLILKGETFDPMQLEMYRQQVKQDFMAAGSKRFLKILEGELAEVPMDVSISIAGKQKDLGAFADKLTQIFSQIIANPQILDDPRAAKIFNAILENAGIDPIEFTAPRANPVQTQQGQQPAPVKSPITPDAQINNVAPQVR